jgi:hypothetical protein
MCWWSAAIGTVVGVAVMLALFMLLGLGLARQEHE